MSKRKIIIIILIVILLIVSIVLFLSFSKKKVKTTTLYGEYSEVVTENINTAYQKSYLMMDCCEEWPDLYKDMVQIKNLVALMLQDTKEFKVATEQQGIFVIAFTGQENIEKPFVSNPECTGQCRACE